MDTLLEAIRKLLEQPGMPTLTIGPIEEDGSVGVELSYLTQVGRIRTLTATDSLDNLAEFLDEHEDWDPR